MITAPRKLTDVVNMIDNICEMNRLIILGAAYPARPDHPIVAGSSNNPIAFYDGAQLFISELPLMGNQAAAIVMTCQHGAIKKIHCLPEGLIGKMSQIENDPKAFHLCQQFYSHGCQSELCGCASCVAARSVMRGS